MIVLVVYLRLKIYRKILIFLLQFIQLLTRVLTILELISKHKTQYSNNIAYTGQLNSFFKINIFAMKWNFGEFLKSNHQQNLRLIN